MSISGTAQCIVNVFLSCISILLYTQIVLNMCTQSNIEIHDKTLTIHISEVDQQQHHVGEMG